MLRVRMLVALSCLVLAPSCARLSPTPLAGQLSRQPATARDHVYVIFVDSPVDLGHWGGLPELTAYFRRSGLKHTWWRNPYEEGCSGDSLAERICGIRRQDPRARVMIVGWSYGCIIALDALQQLADTGVRVDTMVYLDSFSTWVLGGGQQPPNVGRTVLVYRECQPAPTGFPCPPVVHRVDVLRHLNVPMDPHAVEVLFAEACRLAQD